MAHSLAVFGAVIALGMLLGRIRVWGVSLGVAGVMFAGLLFAHFGITVNHHVLEFVREFGLVFFVFMIGLQVGPGFFASFRRQGIALNGFAAGIVLLGALIALGCHYLGSVPIPAVAGMFSGATTNTPSLAAAGEALRQQAGVTGEILSQPDLAYAVTYPMGIVGTILVMLLIRRAFRVDVDAERRALTQARSDPTREIHTQALTVTNPNLAGIRIDQLPGLKEAEAVVSRIYHGGVTDVARADTRLAVGDVVLLVAPKPGLERLRLVIGEPSTMDLRETPGELDLRRVVITNRAVVGQTVGEIDLLRRHGVTVTRIMRGEQQFTGNSGLRLQFADTVVLVGEASRLAGAEQLLGNSPKALNHADLVPIFIGVLCGVVLGSMPLIVPGLPAPLKLGLAGGPLLVAILLARIGKIGPLVWYMPPNANYALREIGIVLFLACVGLKSGGSFADILTSGDGVRWMLLGAAITIVPLVIVGVLARAVWRLNYVSLCGVLSGGMTDPPALAFATTMTGTEDAAVSYVTVYPLTMILRVFTAQIIVLAFM